MNLKRCCYTVTTVETLLLILTLYAVPVCAVGGGSKVVTQNDKDFIEVLLLYLWSGVVWRDSGLLNYEKWCS